MLKRLLPLRGLLALVVGAGLISLAINFTAAGSKPARAPEANAQPEVPARLSDEDAAAVKAVATSFVEAFASYRFDEPIDAPIERAEPFATDELVTTLRSDNSGATALSQQRSLAQESLTAKAESVQILGFRSGVVQVMVITKEELHGMTGTTVSTSTIRLSLVNRAGWKVSEVLL